VQARALGVLAGPLSELRSVIRAGVSLSTYHPKGDGQRWARADDILAAARAALST
jgi:hypothetical protein